MEKSILLKALQYYNLVSLIYFSWGGLNKYKSILFLYTLVLILVNGFIIVKEKINIVAYFRRVSIILLIPMLLILSTVYSISKDVTLNSASMILFITIYSIFLSVIYTKKEFYSTLTKYFVITICAIMFLMIVAPSKVQSYYQGSYVISGVFAHKNILGRNLLIGGIILYFITKNERRFYSKLIYRITILCTIAVIILSKSTTAIILLILFYIFVYLINRKSDKWNLLVKTSFILAILGNIFVLIASNPLFNKILSNIKIGSKNLTLTGRSSIWQFSLKAIKEHFLVGYGYDGFWNNLTVRKSFYYDYYFTVTHSHNGYLNLLLDGGIILLIILLYVIIKTIIWNKNNLNNEYNKITLVLLCFILILNLVETCFISYTTYLVWIIIVFSFCKYKEDKHKAVESD